MERTKLSESLALTHPNILTLDAEVEALKKARTAFVATNPQAYAGANIVTVPDDRYVKSGFPVDELDRQLGTGSWGHSWGHTQPSTIMDGQQISYRTVV